MLDRDAFERPKEAENETDRLPKKVTESILKEMLQTKSLTKRAILIKLLQMFRRC